MQAKCLEFISHSSVGNQNVLRSASIKDLKATRTRILEKLKNEFAGLVDIEYNADNYPDKIEIKPGVLATGKIRSFDSILLHHVSLKLPIYEDYTPSIWPDLITPDFL